MDKLIDLLIDKKELRGINKDLVLLVIKEYAEQFPQAFKLIEEKSFNPKAKEFDHLKKYARKRLRVLHGVFQKNKLSDRKQHDFLLNSDFDFNSALTQKFLKSHLSSFERLNFYDALYPWIESHTGEIKSLVDLGCGLNPLSYSLLSNLKKVFCCDINDEEIDFLRRFFEKNNQFEGEVQYLNLTKKESFDLVFEKSSGSDCVFLFKLLDSLESVRRGSSRELISKINSKFFVVSFSNKTISGKNLIKSERFWFKDILDDFISRGKKHATFSFGYEDYFVIENK